MSLNPRTTSFCVPKLGENLDLIPCQIGGKSRAGRIFFIPAKSKYVTSRTNSLAPSLSLIIE